jgi:hypothetical protein
MLVISSLQEAVIFTSNLTQGLLFVNPISYHISNGSIDIINISFSSLLVEFFIHHLDRLHQLVAILTLDPLFEGSEGKFSIFVTPLQPVVVMRENLLPVFLLEDAVD